MSEKESQTKSDVVAKIAQEKGWPVVDIGPCSSTWPGTPPKGWNEVADHKIKEYLTDDPCPAPDSLKNELSELIQKYRDRFGTPTTCEDLYEKYKEKDNAEDQK